MAAEPPARLNLYYFPLRNSNYGLYLPLRNTKLPWSLWLMDRHINLPPKQNPKYDIETWFDRRTYLYTNFCNVLAGDETKNPTRTIPIAIILTLFLATLAYCSVASVLTLMWPYYDQVSFRSSPNSERCASNAN